MYLHMCASLFNHFSGSRESSCMMWLGYANMIGNRSSYINSTLIYFDDAQFSLSYGRIAGCLRSELPRVEMSKDVQRCPAELVVRVSSAPDCPTSPTINTSSAHHQHKYTRHQYQRHHHHHPVYHNQQTHQKRCHENFAKLSVAGISNFVHISDTSTEYI